jgi:hypothetical protein
MNITIDYLLLEFILSPFSQSNFFQTKLQNQEIIIFPFIVDGCKEQ